MSSLRKDLARLDRDAAVLRKTPDDSAVLIEFGPVKNVRHRMAAGEHDGWLPRVWVDGRGKGDTYAPHGYSKSDAHRLAHQAAREEAARYVGDWRITLKSLPPRVAQEMFDVEDVRCVVMRRRQGRDEG